MRSSLAASFAIVALLAVGYQPVSGAESGGPERVPLARCPLPISRPGTAVYDREFPEFSEVVRRAGVILAGTVEEKTLETHATRCERRGGLAMEIPPEDRHLYREKVPVHSALIRVQQVLKGTFAGDRIKVLMMVERVSDIDITRRIFSFEKGDRFLLLLRRDGVKHRAWAKAPPRTPEEIAALVEGLSDADWRERERCTAWLFETGPPAVPALEKALARNKDPERQWRARSVLDAIRSAFVPDADWGIVKLVDKNASRLAQAQAILKSDARARAWIKEMAEKPAWTAADLDALFERWAKTRLPGMRDAIAGALCEKLESPGTRQDLDPLLARRLEGKCTEPVRLVLDAVRAVGPELRDPWFDRILAHLAGSEAHWCAEQLMATLWALDRSRIAEPVATTLASGNPMWPALDFVRERALAGELSVFSADRRAALARAAVTGLGNKVRYNEKAPWWAELFRALGCPAVVGELIDTLARLQDLRDRGPLPKYWEKWMPRHLCQLAAGILEDLTGRDLGQDLEGWRTWWGTAGEDFQFVK